MEYRKLLLSELRLAVIEGEDCPLTDERLVAATTVNENLLSLGLSLNGEDIVKLAKSSSLYGFYESTKSLLGEVKAKPMYPDFPNQVMNISEAQFRLDQVGHYFSTYGLEFLYGVNVSKGWLPNAKETPKTEDDDLLLSAKRIALIESKNQYIVPTKQILAKRERMTNKERKMVSISINNIPASELVKLEVPFKQNLFDLFYLLFKSDASDDKLSNLKALCKHSGDVIKCIDYSLTREKYHFTNSQKKLFVKLLESYSAKDFKENIILSNKKAERNILIFKFLDFNFYSRKSEHKYVVRCLRNGELKSWESKAKYLIDRKSKATLLYLSERPGILLRMVAMLVRRGFDCKEIKATLMEKADSLSTQTLMRVLTFYGQEECFKGRKRETKCNLSQSREIYDIFQSVLCKKISGQKTLLYGKKVFLDFPDYDLERSTVEANVKSAEGGYIQSGLAYKIPNDIKRLRFFVYWNDKERVDVDLHLGGVMKDGTALEVGWNAAYKKKGAVFSGDITHSNAAEYIDLDLNSDIDHVKANINIFSGKACFGEIDECYVGMMAVSKLGEKVKLYNPANCFFSHYLKGKNRFMTYGYIDVANRCLIFKGTEGENSYYEKSALPKTKFNLKQYLKVLLESQGAVEVQNREDADVALVMGKPSGDTEVSLIDENFFM